jgi:hypothetical protein
MGQNSSRLGLKDIGVLLYVSLIMAMASFGMEGCQQSAKSITQEVESPSLKELRLIQEEEFHRLGFPLHFFHNLCESNDAIIDALAWKKGIEGDPEALKNHCREVSAVKLPTPYENPSNYSILQSRINAIEEVIASQEKLPLPNNPIIFGTAPLGSINAKTQWNPIDGRYIVVYDGGLFTFQYLLSKAIALALPVIDDPGGQVRFSTNKKDILEHLSSDPAAIVRFRQLLDAYIFLGNPGKAKRYILQFPRNRPSTVYLESMQLFVVGHEYGHVVVREKDVSFKNYETTSGQLEELFADQIGLRLSALALKKQKIDFPYSLAGPTLYFKADEIIWKACSILKVGHEEPYPLDRTHPAPSIRLRTLREKIKDELGPEAKEAVGMIDLSEKLEWVIDTLWDRNRAHFEQLYQAKEKKPHPLWDNTCTLQR